MAICISRVGNPTVPVFKFRRFEQNRVESLMSTTSRCLKKLVGLSMLITANSSQPTKLKFLFLNGCFITIT
jgi:hypothetical protein